jgi:uncharacterized membrane protein YoaK (UPF0700 family)
MKQIPGPGTTGRRWLAAMGRSWTDRIVILDLGLAALATASGVTDVTTFLSLGDVFTSAMTGNTALLGIALSQGRHVSATHSVSALIGFSLGALLGAAMNLRGRQSKAAVLEVVRLLVLMEMCCLGAFAAILTSTGPPPESAVLYALILLSAIGMGLQGIAARQINSPGVNTIVFTSTLINIVISLTGTFMRGSEAGGVPPDTKRQIAMFLAYAFGAIIAGILAGPALSLLVWVPMLAVVLALGCVMATARSASS